jgi:hypothetical protein
MTRVSLSGAVAAALLAICASAPALSQGGFQGGVSVRAGDIDNAPAARKRAKAQKPARQRAKGKTPPYTNHFHCIPRSCPTSGAAIGRQLQLVPPW